MNPALNEKLDTIRKTLLAEALPPDSYARLLMNTEAIFLEQVAKVLRKAIGKKLENMRVHNGISVVWLEGSGQNMSDLDTDFTLSLGVMSPHDVAVYLSGHAYGGKVDRDVHFKSGELTPDKAAAIVLELFKQ